MKLFKTLILSGVLFACAQSKAIDIVTLPVTLVTAAVSGDDFVFLATRAATYRVQEGRVNGFVVALAFPFLLLDDQQKGQEVADVDLDAVAAYLEDNDFPQDKIDTVISELKMISTLEAGETVQVSGETLAIYGAGQ